MSKPAEKLLVDQQRALWDYLDALLQEIPEDLDEAAEPPVVEAVAPAPVEVAEAVEEVQEWEVEPVVAVADEIQEWEPEPMVALAETPAVEAEEAPVVEAPAIAAAPEPAPVEEIPPPWSKPDFQALLFKVGGLSLAVPLVKLHSVIPWPAEGVTAMPKQPAWCFGLLRYRDQNVRIVDTEGLVIPDGKRADRMVPKHILVVGDGQWGLACSSIGNVVKLDPEEVKWRTSGGRRPWLAGTVLNHLCALLDTEAFAAMFLENPRSR